MTEILPVGKLPLEWMRRLLDYPISDPRVRLGPGVGLDAAVVEMGDRCLVVKADPITFATEAIGWYAVQINANDIATTGAAHRWMLAILLLPEGRTDRALVEEIFGQLRAACEALGITLIGGHSEVTYGLDRPILAGFMLGEVEAERLITPRGARAGDRLILSKPIAIEGTAVIAREKRAELLPVFGEEFLRRCADFLYTPGISVVEDARIAQRAGRVHAMHDPTEGGLATGLWELAEAAGLGLRVEGEAVPVYPETQALCAHYGLDPWGLLASGSLLIAAPPEDAPAIREALIAAGRPAALIGELRPPEEGRWIERGGRRIPLQPFPRDELARLFEG
jgi:hydrogenase expression/formation protein HypE